MYTHDVPGRSTKLMLKLMLIVTDMIIASLFTFNAYIVAHSTFANRSGAGTSRAFFCIPIAPQKQQIALIPSLCTIKIWNYLLKCTTYMFVVISVASGLFALHFSKLLIECFIVIRFCKRVHFFFVILFISVSIIPGAPVNDGRQKWSRFVSVCVCV